jgi:DNA polymerase-3 subunit beta
MTCKVIVQKGTFADSLAIVGRAVGSHSHLPILSNVLLNKDEGQLRLSATDLTMGVTLWMDANMDGELGITLPAKTLTDVVNS